MRGFLSAVSQAVWQINPFNPAVQRKAATLAQLLTNPHASLAIVLYAASQNEAAAMAAAPVLTACYQVLIDGADHHHHAALYDDGDGPTLNTDGLVETGCVAPLSNATACERLNSTATNLTYCAADACTDSPYTPPLTNPRYKLMTNSPVLLECLINHTFAPGSDSNVCNLSKCDSSGPAWAIGVLAATSITLVIVIAAWVAKNHSSSNPHSSGTSERHRLLSQPQQQPSTGPTAAESGSNATLQT